MPSSTCSIQAILHGATAHQRQYLLYSATSHKLPKLILTLTVDQKDFPHSNNTKFI